MPTTLRAPVSSIGQPDRRTRSIHRQSIAFLFVLGVVGCGASNRSTVTFHEATDVVVDVDYDASRVHATRGGGAGTLAHQPELASTYSPSTATPALFAASPAARDIIHTATEMMGEGVVVRGSCYDYIEAIFNRAGYRGWRQRENIFRTQREGPYANLDAIQPGDWLWIVNYPDRQPMGTHSVLFLGWENRANGHARVIDYVGRRANRPGDHNTRDVTRTYSILRARSWTSRRMR